MPSLPVLRLLNKADRRLRAGHLWIYSNEVDVKATPLKGFQNGEQAVIENAQGKALGVAMISPNNLICARLVSRDKNQMMDKSLLVHRLNIALGLRQRMNADGCYRLVYGDSDQLPGLVVDRFGDIFVVQIATAGMELLKNEVVEALCQVFKPSGILIKNDARIRAADQLPEYVEVAFGEVPDAAPLIENGVQFLAPVHSGQKTGWFYDHRANRARLKDYVAGKRVLDVFSYIGGWGVQAAAFGAESVTCVDSSELALQGVMDNAARNQVTERMRCVQGSAFEVMKAMVDDGERFDVVIIDPPAFIPRRKDIKQGEQAYRRANELAMRLLDRDSILVSASCSMHLARSVLVDILRLSSRHLDRQLQILEHGGQCYDHPIHPAIPETDYLKAVFARLLPVS